MGRDRAGDAGVVGARPVSEPVAEPVDVLDTDRAGGMIVRGGLWRTLAFGAATLMSVGSYALITRHLGVARFGDYQTALSVVTVVATVTDAGMTTLALREHASLKGDERDRVMRNLLGLRLVLTALGVIAALIAAEALGFDEALLIGTGLAGIGIGFNVVQAMIGVPLQVSLRQGAVAALEAGRQFVLLLLIVLVILVGGGVLPLLAATIPAGIVGLLATIVVLRGEAILRPALHPSQWRRLVVLTVPMALTTTASTFYVYVVQIVNEVASDDYQSGLFSAAFRIFVVLASIPGLVIATAFPLLVRAARDDSERLRYSVDRLFRTSLLTGGFIAVTVSVGAPVAIAIIAGPDFERADAVLQVQALALLASFAFSPLAFAMLALRMHREIIAINLTALVVAGTLAAVVSGEYGAEGASWATVAGEVILIAGGWLTLYFRHSELAPRWGAVLPVVPAVVLGAAVGLIDLPSLLGAILAGAVYCIAALACRAIPDELWQAFKLRLPG